jgi:hypothetical protein
MARTRSPHAKPAAPVAPPRSTRPPWLRVPLTLAAFIVVFVGLELNSYTRTSATWDEPIHLADGYVSVTTGDFRVDPEHPPLLRLWAALPLLALPGVTADVTAIDASPPTQWAFRNLFVAIHKMIYVDNDADRMLYPARFMIVVLGALLGCVLFWWVHEWYGYATAVAALILFVAEPNLAAHSALVTTDLGLAFLMFAAIFFLHRAIRSPTIASVAAMIGLTCLAVVSKFSALLLGPMILILLLVATVWTRRLAAGRALTWVAVLGVSSFVTIWASYGFRYAPSASPGWLYKFHQEPFMQEAMPKTAAVVGWIDDRRLLPNVYSEGLLLVQAKAQARQAFFAGDYREDGWWSYFPAAFAIKTPIALLLLASGGLVLYLRRWRRQSIDRELFVLVPILLYGGWAMTARINIGLRHILPIYPFVIVLAAESLNRLWSSGRRAVLVVALVVCCGEFATTYPHNLAFFNLLVGGPDQGSKYLVDSNLDWGQDLKPLKRWMTEHNVPHINLAYFGFADPRYYGIDCTFLPGSPVWFNPALAGTPKLPGYVAVSATVLRGVYATTPEQRAFYAPLEQQRPVASIGHSILVYRVERQWW